MYICIYIYLMSVVKKCYCFEIAICHCTAKHHCDLNGSSVRSLSRFVELGDIQRCK